MKLPLILTTLAIASFAVLPVSRAAEKAATEAQGGSLEKKDLKFVTMAAQGGLFEVEAGRLAEKKGVSPSAKELGGMMVKDHAKANAELKKIAGEKGVTPPASLDAKHAAMLETLSKKEGAEFDAAFVEELDKAHKVDIALFEAAAKDAADPQLKAFAAKTLPVLQMHAQHVKSAQGKNKKA